MIRRRAIRGMAADTTDRRHCASRPSAGWPTTPTRPTRDELRAVLDGLPASAGRAGRPVRRAADLRHGRAARPAAGRPERDEPRRGHPGRRRPGRLARRPGAATGPLVIGYDARHGSRRFAERDRPGGHRRGPARAAAAPAAAHPGARVRGAGTSDAVAGVMVTASHNPPQDNGYKVYLGRRARRALGAGAQIVPPADAGIEAAIRAVGPLADGAARRGRARCSATTSSPSYVDGPSAVLDRDAARGTADRRVHAAARGGRGRADRRLRPGRFRRRPAVVAEQAEPDPAFPDGRLPQPGGAGRDGPAARAGRPRPARTSRSPTTRTPTGARWPFQRRTGWRMLRGDEVGVLLADHLMRRGVTRALRHHDRLVVPAAGRVCRPAGPAVRRDADRVQVDRPGRRRSEPLVFGYEEALGYCVAPSHVRDKDGITAALTVAELAAGLKARGPHADRPAGRAGRRVRRAPHRPALGPGGRPARDRRRDGPAPGRPPSALLGQPVHRSQTCCPRPTW